MTATYTATLPPLPSHEGRAVALDAVLAARDARVARQQAMLAQGGVLLSLTLVAPGAVKRSPLLDAIFAAALAALRPLVDDARARIEAVDDSGHHALYLLDGEARDWKTRMLALENRAPLSRLWDIDIIDRVATWDCRRAAASSATTTPKPARASAATTSPHYKRTSPAVTACTNRHKR